MSKESNSYKNSPKKIYIRTFGCQMNEYDSERVKDLLLQDGYSLSDTPEEADMVLFNTCSVRKHAEDRVFGKVGALRTLKEKRPGVIFGILGCMAEAQKDLIFQRLPHVDFLCGPSDLDKVPIIIDRIKNGSGRLMYIEGYSSKRIPEFPKERFTGNHVYVKIMEGCSNFCSYCIVPYVRGQERSRPSNEILQEIGQLIEKGVRNITLLGQNVNSYGRGLKEKIDFTGLLEKIDNEIASSPPKADPRNDIENRPVTTEIEIDFITSHPKDADKGLFKIMADSRVISKKLHLPLQSGSNKILKRMNRGYTLEKYKRSVKDFRRLVKGSSLTADLIVGFPGETERDFNETLAAVEEIQFDAAYIFKYSPRPFTAAARFKDDVPQKEKERRHRLLLETQKRISLAKKAKV